MFFVLKLFLFSSVNENKPCLQSHLHRTVRFCLVTVSFHFLLLKLFVHNLVFDSNVNLCCLPAQTKGHIADFWSPVYI